MIESKSVPLPLSFRQLFVLMLLVAWSIAPVQAADTIPGPTPVNCQVSDWSAWSACSASCGGGVQTRTRSITTPAQFGGAACPALSETRACNTQSCAPDPIDCQVSDWSDWSACSASCGGGVRVRNRSILVPAQFGGQSCPATQQTEACNILSCTPDPVDPPPSSVPETPTLWLLALSLLFLGLVRRFYRSK